MIKVAPSILAFNQLRMSEDIDNMISAGCDMLHFDVMDGHFVPNYSFGPELLKAISSAYDIPLDVHLMMDNPEKYIPIFVANGADSITIHPEIGGNISEILQQIHGLGVKNGIALKPDTCVEQVQELLENTDKVLVMTVEPGFGGQKFREEMVEKIRQLRRIGYEGEISVDGGVSMANIQMLAEAGINTAVMGTALYRSQDRKTMISQIHSL